MDAVIHLGGKLQRGPAKVSTLYWEWTDLEQRCQSVYELIPVITSDSEDIRFNERGRVFTKVNKK